MRLPFSEINNTNELQNHKKSIRLTTTLSMLKLIAVGKANKFDKSTVITCNNQ